MRCIMLKKKLLKKLGLLLSCLIVVEIIILYPKEKPTISLKSEEETGVIYLLDENNYVARLDFMFTATSNKGKIKEIVDVLTINNHNSLKIREGFKAVIPENTKLMNIEIKKDLVNLDFSKEILNVDEKYEEKLVEALIYSITALKDINKISLLVNGKRMEKLPHSHKKLDETLDRSYKINKEYDLKSMHNISEVTIYYLAKKNDYLYYIPVTKYTNNEKEKVEIIIDELKSSSTYKANLISYINEETQLINYELLDKSLILNFNEQILSDINSSNIIEEVTYAINLSVQENYDIDNVSYSINDNIISNYFLLLG